MAAKKKPMKKAARKAPAKRAAPKKAAAGKAAPKKKFVKAVPDGYHAITAYLAIDGASAAIDFYKRAFGARERLRMEAPGGKVGHAEITIGDSALMLADEFPDMQFFAPKPGVGVPVNIHLYVKNVDDVFQKAIAAGAEVVRAIEDKFYGDRTGSLRDPFGHIWHLATHTEDLTPAEMKRRGAEESKKASGG
jgi:PhnB protein